MKRFYVAGRIADEKDFLQKFQRACAEVEQLGHEPVSPCDIHDNDCNHQQWEEWMVCDLHAMLDCHGVYALCDWQSSKGATIEVQLAMRLGKEIIYQSISTPSTTDPPELQPTAQSHSPLSTSPLL